MLGILFPSSSTEDSVRKANNSSKEASGGVCNGLWLGQLAFLADVCDIKFSTVHSHIKHIYEKLHVNSAPEVVKALEMRLV